MTRMFLNLYNFDELDLNNLCCSGSFVSETEEEGLQALKSLVDELHGPKVEVLEIEIKGRKVIPLDRLGSAF